MTNNWFRSFSCQDNSDYRDRVCAAIKSIIDKLSDEYILNVNEQEYFDYLYSEYSLEPLCIDLSSEKIHEPEEVKRQLNDDYTSAIYGGQGVVLTYQNFTISYSFTGSAVLFKLRPNPFTLTSHEINVDEVSGLVSFCVEIRELDPEIFNREKESAFKSAFCNLEKINNNVNGINREIKSTIEQYFKREKAERIKKHSFWSAINVQRSANAPTTYGVPLIKRTVIPKPQPSSQTKRPLDPQLEIEAYKNIIQDINNIGKSIERKQSLHSGKDEEALRDLIVANLETRYEGITATGETFNLSGKTDILLKNASDGTNLFIAECKIWHGEKKLLEAIDQLFNRYLTWRDSKVALILFVRDGNFSAILSTIKNSIPKHHLYVKELGQTNESSLSYIFSFPDDGDKKVYLEVIAFNFKQND